MTEELRIKTRDWERLLSPVQQEKYKLAIKQGWFANYHDNDRFSFRRHILAGFINYKNEIGRSEIQIEEMKAYILEKTTIDEKTFNKNKNKDWYLTSDELLKYKVIDDVITDLSVII